MTDEKYIIRKIRDEPKVEVEWTLRNVENAVLVNIIEELLEILKNYQKKYSEAELR